MRRSLALLSVVSAMAGLAAPPRAPQPVTIDATMMRRLNVTIAPLRASAQAARVTGFARVLDPIPLAMLDADIATAAPAEAASRAEAGRSRALFAADATVSRKVAEAAAAQARGDTARLGLLRRRLGLEWGPAIARMSDGQRAALVAALVAGRAALVRIDTSGGVGQADLRSATLDLGGLGTAVATILGPARAADPRLQSPGLIARVSGRKAASLSTGLTIPATIGGSARSGVLIPASAVLRLGGGVWIYVQSGSTRFERRMLGGIKTVPGGLFATIGPRAGERIAVSGAAALYAAEQGGGAREE